uniref:Eukaryotic translation initiation factor 4C n=1 Tax=Hyaloperonospora arabidopsidis (strain Emoy2) TaxID=559515 RepID=M4C0F9_HYAAE
MSLARRGRSKREATARDVRRKKSVSERGIASSAHWQSDGHVALTLCGVCRGGFPIICFICAIRVGAVVYVSCSCDWLKVFCVVRHPRHNQSGICEQQGRAMPKNKGKGGKNRRRGKNDNDENKRELDFKEEGQEYAQVVRMLGNGRLEAYCFDGVTRLGHIRGKMRKKVWVGAGDIILVSLRERTGSCRTMRVLTRRLWTWPWKATARTTLALTLTTFKHEVGRNKRRKRACLDARIEYGRTRRGKRLHGHIHSVMSR